MTNFQSRPDLESSVGGAPETVQPQGSSLFFMTQLLQALAEQTVILKRINSKLWKLNDMLSREGQEKGSDKEWD